MEREREREVRERKKGRKAREGKHQALEHFSATYSFIRRTKVRASVSTLCRWRCFPPNNLHPVPGPHPAAEENRTNSCKLSSHPHI